MMSLIFHRLIHKARTTLAKAPVPRRVPARAARPDAGKPADYRDRGRFQIVRTISDTRPSRGLHRFSDPSLLTPQSLPHRPQPDRPAGHALGDTGGDEPVDRQALALDDLVEVAGIPALVEEVIPGDQPG